jgi:putative thioredoxin
VIGPVLEKLAAEYEGRVELVKVNMDESPMLAQALMIRSIPAVKLFMNGEIRDEFAGAYPEAEVRRFLEHHLPAVAAQQAVAGLSRMREGNREEAVETFKQVLEKDPTNAPALLGMGHHHADNGDLAAAQEVVRKINGIELDKLPDAKAINRDLAALQGRIYLLEHAQDTGGAAAKPEVVEAFNRAVKAALEGAHQQALEDFLVVVKKDRKFKEDAGRKGMLAVFAMLPPDARLVDDYRAKLSLILFS